MMKRLQIDSSSDEDEECFNSCVHSGKKTRGAASLSKAHPQNPAMMSSSESDSDCEEQGTRLRNEAAGSDKKRADVTNWRQLWRIAQTERHGQDSSSEEDAEEYSKDVEQTRVVLGQARVEAFNKAQRELRRSAGNSHSNPRVSIVDRVESWAIENRSRLMAIELPVFDRDFTTNVYNQSMKLLSEIKETDVTDYERRWTVLSTLMGSTPASIVDEVANCGEQLKGLWQSIYESSTMFIQFASKYMQAFCRLAQVKKDNRLIPFQRLLKVVFLRQKDCTSGRYTDINAFLSCCEDVKQAKEDATTLPRDISKLVDDDFYKKMYADLIPVRDKFLRPNGRSRASTNKRNGDVKENLRAYPFLPVIPFEYYIEHETLFESAFNKNNKEAIDRLRRLAEEHGATLEQLREAHSFECEIHELQQFFFDNLYSKLFFNQSILFKDGPSTGMAALYILSGTHTNVRINFDNNGYDESTIRLDSIRTFHRLMSTVCNISRTGVSESDAQVHQKFTSEQIRVQQLVDVKYHVVVMLCSWIEKLYGYKGHPDFENNKRKFKSDVFGFKTNDIDSITGAWKNESKKQNVAPSRDTVGNHASNFDQRLQGISEIDPSEMPDNPTLEIALVKCKIQSWKLDASSFETRVDHTAAKYERILELSKVKAGALHARRRRAQEAYDANPESEQSIDQQKDRLLNETMIFLTATQEAICDIEQKPREDKKVKELSETFNKWSKEALERLKEHSVLITESLDLYSDMVDGMHCDKTYDYTAYFEIVRDDSSEGIMKTIRDFSFSKGEHKDLKSQARELDYIKTRLFSYKNQPKHWLENAFSSILGCFYKACVFLGFNSDIANPAPLHPSKCQFPILSRAVVHAMFTACHVRGHLLITDDPDRHAEVVAGRNSQYVASALSSPTTRDARLAADMHKFASESKENWTTCTLLMRIAESFFELNNGAAFDVSNIPIGGDEHFDPKIHSSIVFGSAPAPLVVPKDSLQLSKANEYTRALAKSAGQQYPCRYDWRFEDIDTTNFNLIKSLWTMNSEIFKQNGFLPVTSLQTHSPGHCLYEGRVGDEVRALKDQPLYFHSICEAVPVNQSADAGVSGTFGA
jgi:hypothetical protein